MWWWKVYLAVVCMEASFLKSSHSCCHDPVVFGPWSKGKATDVFCYPGQNILAKSLGPNQ